MLVHRLTLIYPYMCKGGSFLYGSLAAIIRAANRRLYFLGRRCKALSLAPGYVVAHSSPYLFRDRRACRGPPAAHQCSKTDRMTSLGPCLIAIVVSCLSSYRMSSA